MAFSCILASEAVEQPAVVIFIQLAVQ